LILIFYISTGIFLNLVIPPFQNPDEPQHFGLILTYSLGDGKKDYIEKEMFRLMDRNSWWRFVGVGRPPILPDKFIKMDFLNFPDFRAIVGNTVLYHYLLGKIQNVFIKGKIILSYYFCRLISILLMISSIFLIYSSLRKISSITTSPIFLSSFLSILFLPQLMIISVSVNPDSLSFFLSALFFFAFFSLITEKFNIRYFVLLFLAADLGLFTDKSIFFLVIMLILSPFFWIRKKNLQHDFRLAFIFFLVSLLLISWIAWYFPTQFYNSLSILKSSALDNLSGIGKLFSIDDFSKNYFLFLSDSFFLKFGWMAFSANKIFYYLLRILILLSFVGLIIYLGKYSYFKVKKIDYSLSNPLLLKLVLFSIFAISFQILGIWMLWGSKNILPQGRYLFPTIIPIVFLFWLGIDNLFSIFHRQAARVAMCALVIGEFLFLNYAIWNDIIPVFHLTIKAPHAGI
jgi:hypothetical protein